MQQSLLSLSPCPLHLTFRISEQKSLREEQLQLREPSHFHLQCGLETQDFNSLSTKPHLSHFQALPSHACLSSPVLTLLISRHLTPCFAWTLPSARQHIDGL